MRTAKNKIRYHLKGEGKETYHPYFSYQGFRYVRIDHFPGEIKIDQFTGLVLYSALDTIGEFSCSDAELNQLYQNALWGQKGNFLDIPTDCPQRDERMGWTGDAQIFEKTAMMNMNAKLFFEKWLKDLAYDQRENGAVPDIIPFINDSHECSAGWGDAATILPWTVYWEYGDDTVLEQQYDSMKKWVSYVRAQGENEFLWNTGFHYGDWLGLDAVEGSYEGSTRKDLIATAYFARSVKLLSDTALVLGKEEEAEEYGQLFDKIKEAFKEAYVEQDKLVSDTQTAYAVALHFDLIDSKYAKRLAELVIKNQYSLATGFIGTPYILHALSDQGYGEIAYRLLLKRDYPSWIYPITKGATTIWEHWDGIKPDGSFWSEDMNSFNHYAYGAVMDWIYTKMCGIQSVAAGYQKIRIAPLPYAGMKYAKASIQTPYGMVESKWEMEGRTARHTITIPYNVEAYFVSVRGEEITLVSGVNVITQEI